jgi:CCR4-NOT transcriptional regulation complex NOT5 subunit
LNLERHGAACVRLELVIRRLTRRQVVREGVNDMTVDRSVLSFLEILQVGSFYRDSIVDRDSYKDFS